MNKRRRKKLRKGEFRELGCHLHVKLLRTLSEDDLDTWWNDFIDAIVGMGLSVGGGGHYEHEYGVSSAAKRSSVTVTQQEELRRWLSSNPMVESFQVSQLFDCWYPPKHMLE